MRVTFRYPDRSEMGSSSGQAFKHIDVRRTVHRRQCADCRKLVRRSLASL